MRTMLLVICAGIALSLSANAKDSGCEAWSEYMANMIAPPVTIGNPMMGMSGTDQPPNGEAMGFGFGMMGIGMGIGAPYVPPLTDRVKAGLKGDSKTIKAKYDQVVITMSALIAEWGEVAQMHKDGALPESYRNPKIEQLGKKIAEQTEAYKKELFAYGKKNDCMQDFENELHKRQYNEVSKIIRLNRDILKQKNDMIDELRKLNKQALSALEECKSSAPTVSGKLQKQLDELQEALKKQTSCPGCGSGAAF